MAASFATLPSQGRLDLSDGHAPASEWSQHEHLADAVTKEAQRLVNLAGSIELAKQAIEAAAEPAPRAVKEAFARQLGYEGLGQFRAATVVVESHDGVDWNLTRDREGRWIAWNEENVRACGTFDSREQAVQELRGSTDGWRL